MYSKSQVWRFVEDFGLVDKIFWSFVIFLLYGDISCPNMMVSPAQDETVIDISTTVECHKPSHTLYAGVIWFVSMSVYDRISSENMVI